MGKVISLCHRIIHTKVSGNITILLPAATKLGQGNIFTSVCQEFCPQGGGCLPQCMLGYPPPPRSRQHPPELTPSRPDKPPRADTPPPDQTPPWADTPPEQTPPGPDTPCSSRPPRHTPREGRLQHTVYERPVRILLECILVFHWFQVLHV